MRISAIPATVLPAILPAILPTILAASLLLGLTAGPVYAAERTHDIVPEDYFDQISLGNLAVSPGGEFITYTESRWGQDEEGRVRDLWLIRHDGTGLRRLTFDNFGATRPVWSRDGKFIYFIGREDTGQDDPPRDGSRQIWRIAPDGTGLLPLTRAADGVGSFVVTADARAVYYTVTEEKTDEEWPLKKEYSDLEYGHGVTDLDAVRKLDLTSWRDEEIHPADRVIWEMSLSPSGKKLAMITTSDNELIFLEGWSRVDLLDLSSGQVTQLTDQEWRTDHPSPYGWIEELAWAGDSQALAFSISYDGFASQIWVAEQAGSSWALHKVRRPQGVNFSGTLKWWGASRTLCFRGESRGRIRVYGTERVTGGSQGGSRILTPGDLVVSAYYFDRTGRTLAAIAETTTHLNDIFVSKSTEPLTRLTNVNPQVDTWRLPQIQHVSWVGADGDTCSGILELPPGYQAGDGPLPTIIELHGGPTSSTKYRLQMWIYGRALMPSKGYALLSPNYHGSTGYGDAFLEKLIGRENEIEVTDILTGTRWMIDQGLADPAHIGVLGWSNGGYLTNCVIAAEPDLFAAASSGAGILDMVLQWGTEDTPGHVVNFMRGLPWEQPGGYQKASPLYQLDKVKTPTLIHVGGSDPRVPPTHSRALYRALKHYLDVPCELVVYPGEPHGLTTHENRLAKMEWDLAWFEKYLRPEPEVLEINEVPDRE